MVQQTPCQRSLHFAKWVEKHMCSSPRESQPTLHFYLNFWWKYLCQDAASMWLGQTFHSTCFTELILNSSKRLVIFIFLLTWPLKKHTFFIILWFNVLQMKTLHWQPSKSLNFVPPIHSGSGTDENFFEKCHKTLHQSCNFSHFLLWYFKVKFSDSLLVTS